MVQKRGTDRSWIIDACPEGFSGEKPISVEPGPIQHRGMTVMFPQNENDDICDVVKRAARYCPLEVVFEGNVLDRKDYLGDAVHVEEWKGVRIGVFHEPTRLHSRVPPNANFHGVTLRMRLPSLHQEFHHSFHAQIDVVRCSDLKLVLPARKEVVQDAFFDQLKTRIQWIYFELIQKAGVHSLSRRDHGVGLQLGIELPEAEKLLRPFVPDQANHYQNLRADPVPVSAEGALYIDSAGAVEEQNVFRAIEKSSEMGHVYEPCPAFQGYKWYEEMTRIRWKGYGAVVNGGWLEISDDERFGFNERPDCLSVVLEVSDRHKDLCLDTDALVVAEEYVSFDEADIHVVAASDLTPDALTSLLEDALFSPSDDP